MIQATSSSVIGLIGVDEEADSETFPINTPILLTGNKRRMMARRQGGPLYKAIKAIKAQQNQSAIQTKRFSSLDQRMTLFFNKISEYLRFFLKMTGAN